MDNLFLANNFYVHANATIYQVKPQYFYNIILYCIFQENSYLFNIGIDEQGRWKPFQVCDELQNGYKDEILARKIGDAIELYTS